MPITVHIPTILRPSSIIKGVSKFPEVNVLEVIDAIEHQYPGVKERLVTDGISHSFINIYVNDDDIRFGKGLSTELRDGDSLTILPAVAGG